MNERIVTNTMMWNSDICNSNFSQYCMHDFFLENRKKQICDLYANRKTQKLKITSYNP